MLLLIMFIGAELFIYQIPFEHPKPTKAKIEEKKVVNDVYYESLHFSNERLPADDAKVKIKVAADIYPFNFYVITPKLKKDGGGFDKVKIGI